MNNPMPLEIKISALMLAASLAAAPLCAQSGTTRQQDPERAAAQQGEWKQDSGKWTPNIVRHDKIVGVDIHRGSASGMGQSGDANRSGQTGQSGQSGQRGVGTENDSDKPEAIGELTDLVLSRKDGSIEFAVVTPNSEMSAGDGARLVPWNKFSYQRARTEDGEGKLMANIGATDLRHMATFDSSAVDASLRDARERMQRSGLEGSDGGSVAGSGSTTRDRGVAEASGSASAGSKGEFILATEAVDLTVMAGEEDLGSLENLYIETDHGQVVFATIGTGGLIGLGETERPIPWSVFQWQTKAGEEQPTLSLPKTAKDLETAPKIGDDEGAIDLKDPAAREKVYSFYGAQKPKCEQPKSGGSKSDAERSRDGERREGERREGSGRR